MFPLIASINFLDLKLKRTPLVACLFGMLGYALAEKRMLLMLLLNVSAKYPKGLGANHRIDSMKDLSHV